VICSVRRCGSSGGAFQLFDARARSSVRAGHARDQEDFDLAVLMAGALLALREDSSPAGAPW
jgi:hypothetical protein